MPVILSPNDYDPWLEPEFHGQGKLLDPVTYTAGQGPKGPCAENVKPV
jgi:hypothetical protein